MEDKFRLKNARLMQEEENRERQRKEDAARKRQEEELLAANEAAWERSADNYRKLIDLHFATISRKVRSSVSRNDYGAIERDDRGLEIETFMRSVGINLNKYNFDMICSSVFLRMEMEDIEAEQKEFDPDTFPENGLDFERLVADALKKFGWKATVTVGSGDQGVDVIAEKGPIRAAIQCKLYKGPVGNKAVQEALAGTLYYRSNATVVITNSDYTKSAHELARVSKIVLAKYKDIPRLEALILDNSRR